jgi:hypothetical protein
MFPYANYDVVIVDSLDSHAEGVGEQDSSKPSRAIAPLLDIAHREKGPAVLVLGNCVRTGNHSRGSGVIEDRADIVYEVRDITGWTPTGDRDWWEELPAAGASDWASRTTRRKRRERVSLAFICTKFRGEEPEPFALRIDFTTEPRAFSEITHEIDKTGAEARETRRREREERLEVAARALVAEVKRLAEASEPPLNKDRGKHSAVEFLKRKGLERNEARQLLKLREGVDWTFKPIAGERGHTLGVFAAESKPAPESRTNENSGADEAALGTAQSGGAENPHLRYPHEQPLAQMPIKETCISAASNGDGDLRRPSNTLKPVQQEIGGDLALKIRAYLETLPTDQKATADEIAEALHGRNYTLSHVAEAYRVCEELREAQILIRGRDGYGHQVGA